VLAALVSVLKKVDCLHCSAVYCLPLPNDKALQKFLTTASLVNKNLIALICLNLSIKTKISQR